MLKTSLKWVGILLTLFSAVYCFYNQPIDVTITVFLSLGVIYLLVVFLSKESFYLYFATAFLILSYLIFLYRATPPDYYALLGFILFLFIYLLALALQSKRPEFSKPLDIVGHSLAVIWIGFIALNQGEMVNLFLLFFSLSLYLAADLFWYRFKANPWYLMPLVLTFSLICALFPYQPFTVGVVYLLTVVTIYGLLIFFISRSNKWHDAAQPVYSAGVLVALGGMALAFWGELGWMGNLVLVLSAALFMMTMSVFKKWEFIYLMILALAILANNFLKVANDSLYSQLAVYIRPGIALMGLIFLYPLVKSLFSLKWSLSSFLIATRTRTFFIFLPILFFLIYVAFDYAMVVTENPYFCGSCHTMETPFRTWKSAVHYRENTGCFDCHYKPGVTNFFRGRIYGLLMVVKYFTGYYLPKSSANVSDASCLREGCHTKTKEDLYQPILCEQFEDTTIKFNHEVMLTQQNFGIELKCNNCHEHVSEESGEHFEVSAVVCYYCHLMNPKDASIGTAIGTCFTCHETEGERIEEQSFVLVGSGKVSPERCLDCHYTIERFDDTQYQHDIHINWNTDFTKTKVECGSCHGEIRHGRFGS